MHTPLGATASRLMFELANLAPEYPGRWALSADITYLLGCRHFVQWCGTLRSIIDPARFCLFCHPELMTAQPIEEEGGWLAKPNDYPYAHHNHHFVLFPKRHVMRPDELTDEDALARFHLERRLMERFGFKGCGSVMRIGDPRHTVATVPHAHSQLQVPDGLDVSVAYFGKAIGHQIEDYDRLKKYAQRFKDQGGISWLMDPATIPQE